MDFSLTDDQRSIADLARQVFTDAIDDRYHPAFEASGKTCDTALWQTLADTGLLGTAVGEDYGGSGLGWQELMHVLQAQGNVLAPVPLWSALVCAEAVQRWGDDSLKKAYLPAFVRGEQWLTAALEEVAGADYRQPVRAADDGKKWRLDGTVSNVPVSGNGDLALIPAATDDGRFALCLLPVDHPSVRAERQTATNCEPRCELTFRNTAVKALAVVPPAELDRLASGARTAVSALTLGVVEEALARTAQYTGERRQFGRPIASFQAVSHRAADGYIDREALRSNLWQAAWRLDAGRDAGMASQSAKWWAAEAAHRIGHTAQHLHGGIGSDLEYPIHRYFLWAKELEFSLGGARRQLAASGRRLAEDDTVRAAL